MLVLSLLSAGSICVSSILCWAVPPKLWVTSRPPDRARLSTPVHRKTRLLGHMEIAVPHRAVKSGLSAGSETLKLK